jgi:phosphoserine phosphatase
LATLAGQAPLGEGAVQAVIDLRRLGYSVGIMSDYFLIWAEVARRRVFADFSVGHMLDYKHGRCTGEIRLTEAYTHPDGCGLHDPCKSNILCRLAERGIAGENVVVVGRGASDVCLMAKSSLGIAFSPRDDACRRAADIVVDGPDLNQLVAHLAEPASII